MHSVIADTDPKAERVYTAILRRLSAWEKANLIADMAESGRELVLLNIRKRYPQAGEEEILRYLAERMLGSELAKRVYGPLPEARSDNG
jgi:HEPN domain-containing protein